MIKLPKKVMNAITREFKIHDITIIKRVYIHSMFKELCVNLVTFRIGQSESVNILRYFGDGSYSILGGYANEKEITEEIAYQVKQLY